MQIDGEVAAEKGSPQLLSEGNYRESRGIMLRHGCHGLRRIHIGSS